MYAFGELLSPPTLHFVSREESTPALAQPNFETSLLQTKDEDNESSSSDRQFGVLSEHLFNVELLKCHQGQFSTFQHAGHSLQQDQQTQVTLEFTNESQLQAPLQLDMVQVEQTLQPTWQLENNADSSVMQHLTNLQTVSLPINLEQVQKIPVEGAKKEPAQQEHSIQKSKKKKRKRAPKERARQPAPGEVRITTALDGATLFCCPECHMGYRERELLEQHLVGHKLERRFICDICGAGLKRKDHLTRHKHSHNPERPFICSICSKAFKRKEQLTLHFVIHSGEKRHVCPECSKGFYRKDHLRKHMRSHLSRSMKTDVFKHNVQSKNIN